MSNDSEGISGLAKGAGVVLLGTLVSKPLALLGNIVIIRALEPAQFGQLALGFTIASLTAAILLLGIPEGVTRLSAAASGPANRRQIETTGYVLAGIGGIVGAGVLYLLRGDISEFMQNEQLGHTILFFVPFVIGQPIAQVFIGALRGIKLSGKVTLIRDIGGRIIPLIVLFVLLVVGKPILAAVSYWVLTPFVIVLIGVFYRKWGATRPATPQMITRESVTRLVSFSWPLALEGVLVLVMSSLDILMIGFFLGSQEVGLYRSIQPVVGVILIVLSSIVFIYLPLATEYYESQNYEQLGNLFATSAKWASAATFPLTVVLILFSEEIVTSLFGVDYAGASIALAILAAGTFLRVLVGPNGATIKAINRSRIDLISSIVGAGVNAVLNLILIPIYGINGAAIATATGFLAFNVIELIVIYRQVGATPFSWDSFKPMPVTVAATLIIMHFSEPLQKSLVFLIILGALISVVHLIAFHLTGSIGPEDKQLLRVVRTSLRSVLGDTESPGTDRKQS